MAQAGKIAEVLFENMLDTYEEQNQLIKKTDVFTPDSGTMQNSDNVIWRPVEQHAPIIEGWDMTGKETDIIEETYPAVLGVPKNDFVVQRVDQLRDKLFWERRGRTSGKQQSSELNKSIAEMIMNQGSLFYKMNTESGLGFIGEAQTIMNERQGVNTDRCFVLNDRSTLRYAKDLASRETVKGRPESAWLTGQIGSKVADFDLFTGSYCPNLVGGATPTTPSLTAEYVGIPEGGTVNATTKVVTNVDYREAVLALTATTGWNVGDKFTIANVLAVGVSDKTLTQELMTFTVVEVDGKGGADTLTIFPKPISANAADHTGVGTQTAELFAAYGNVDSNPQSGALLVRLNTDATAQTNLFFDRDAIEVIGGDVPMDLMKQYDGMKVIKETLGNGLNAYMVYDANMVNLNLRYRLFTWYGLSMKDPSRAGVALSA